MAKKTYSEKLRNPQWQKKRLEIMQRDNFTCRLCGDTETTLNVHHTEYSKWNPWDVDSDTLFTLCEHCHEEINIINNSGVKISADDFNKERIKIHKDNTWIDNSRIMFVYFFDELIISIYDGQNNFIDGYKFVSKYNLQPISEIINFAIKNMPL